MTEEELKKDIVWKIQKYPYNPKFQKNAEEIATEIVKTIREAGWKSPEEIPNATTCPKCNELHWIK